MFRGRSWTRRVGVVLLLACFIATTGALPHTDGFEDLACTPVPISHDASAHHIGSAPSSYQTEAQHCFLCHTARSFCSVLEKFEPRDDGLRAERPHTAPTDRSAVIDWTVALGRAPPV